jgi:hypothetical protein
MMLDPASWLQGPLKRTLAGSSSSRGNGNSYLNASRYKYGQSEKLPSMKRKNTRSALFGVKVHSAAASSISNLQFCGAKLGCVGARSVPITSADGYWSAISIAQIPVPVPISMIR